MSYTVGLAIAGGVLTYLFGISILSALHGYKYPHAAQLEDIEWLGIYLWPIALVLAGPVCIFAGIIFVLNCLSDVIRTKAQESRLVAYEEQRRQREISNEIDNMEMFEDGVNE